jgi:hypothetical protein
MLPVSCCPRGSATGGLRGWPMLTISIVTNCVEPQKLRLPVFHILLNVKGRRMLRPLRQFLQCEGIIPD